MKYHRQECSLHKINHDAFKLSKVVKVKILQKKLQNKYFCWALSDLIFNYQNFVSHHVCITHSEEAVCQWNEVKQVNAEWKAWQDTKETQREYLLDEHYWECHCLMMGQFSWAAQFGHLPARPTQREKSIQAMVMQAISLPTENHSRMLTRGAAWFMRCSELNQ